MGPSSLGVKVGVKLASFQCSGSQHALHAASVASRIGLRLQHSIDGSFLTLLQVSYTPATARHTSTVAGLAN
jgi:hypothetical protein